jgi:hypothetical protein
MLFKQVNKTKNTNRIIMGAYKEDKPVPGL